MFHSFFKTKLLYSLPYKTFTIKNYVQSSKHNKNEYPIIAMRFHHFDRLKFTSGDERMSRVQCSSILKYLLINYDSTATNQSFVDFLAFDVQSLTPDVYVESSRKNRQKNINISIYQTKKHDILVLMKCCKKARTYQLLNKLGTATEGIEMNHTFRFIPNSLCKLKKKNVHTKFFLIKLFFTSRINQKRINSFI